MLASWWEDMERNGEFLPLLASSFTANGVDLQRDHGPGGAELITHEPNTKPRGPGAMAAAHYGRWRRPGRGYPGAEVPAHVLVRKLERRYRCETYPQTWSARGAVAGGYAYLAAGYTNTSRPY